MLPSWGLYQRPMRRRMFANAMRYQRFMRRWRISQSPLLLSRWLHRKSSSELRSSRMHNWSRLRFVPRLSQHQMHRSLRLSINGTMQRRQSSIDLQMSTRTHWQSLRILSTRYFFFFTISITSQYQSLEYLFNNISTLRKSSPKNYHASPVFS